MVPTPSKLPARSKLLVVLSATTLTALALVGGWFLRSGNAPESATQSMRAGDAKATVRDGVAPADADPSVAGSADDDAMRERLPEGVGASLADAPLCAPGPEDGVRVHVVAADDRRPLPGARVYVVPINSDANFTMGSFFNGVAYTLSLFDFAPPYFTDPGRLTEAGARGFLADANGEARIEWPHTGAALLGFQEGLRGAQLLDARGDAPIEFALAKPEDLRVEVVARDGHPIAGALVQVGRLSAADGTTRPLPLQFGFATDASGRVRIVGCELTHGVHPRGIVDEKAPLIASVAFVGTSRESAWTELTDAVVKSGTARITVAQPFGVIELRAMDAKGRVKRVNGGTTLFDRGAVPASGILPESSNEALFSWPSHARTLDRGVARFAPVALGEIFQSYLTIAPPQQQWKVMKGPAADGEVVRIDIPVDRELRAVHGRIVGIDPPLAADADFEVTPTSRIAMNRPSLLPSTLSEGGAFRVEVASVAFVRVEALQIHVELRGKVAAYEASVKLPEIGDDPEVDVGDVVAHPIPVLVAGRVVDDLGRPVAGTRITIGTETSYVNNFGDISSGICVTDANGRFARFETSERPDPILAATPPPGFARTLVPFQPGARDVEVVVARTGTILGTIAVDLNAGVFAELHGGGASIQEMPSFRDEHPRSPRTADEESAGLRSFHLELRPGRYDVFVTGDRQTLRTDLLARVDDVEVRPGVVTTDPRLSPLLFRSQLSPWRIELSRADGGPAPTSWVCLAPSDAPAGYWKTAFSATGTVEFEATLDTAWIDVFAVSFRRVHQLCTHGKVAIALEPVDQDDVAFDLQVDAAADLADLEFRVVADSDPPLPTFMHDTYSSRLVAGTTASVSLDQGLKWTVHLFVARVWKESNRPLATVELHRFARGVKPSAEPVRFEVTPGDVDEARASLGQQISR